MIDFFFTISSRRPIADVRVSVEVQTRSALELLVTTPQTGVVTFAVARHAAETSWDAFLFLKIRK